MRGGINWTKVGERLRKVRAVLGITEQVAAAAFGVTLHTYRDYKAGRRQVHRRASARHGVGHTQVPWPALL